MIGQETLLKNFVGGKWEPASAASVIAVRNPATGDVLAEAPLSGATDVAKAVAAASKALQGWRRTPAGDRIQPLFRLKALLDVWLFAHVPLASAALVAVAAHVFIVLYYR